MTGKFGVQAVSLLLSFVLTRLLSPEEFGIAGIAMVIVFVAFIFLDMGFARALVQKKEVGQPEYSSVFFLNLLLGILLMVVCFFTAGPLAIFYEQKKLEPVLKTLSVLFLINSLSLVPGAILLREMKFKWIAVAGMIGAVAAGVISILMAVRGYGVWSLVAQYLISASLTAILSFCFVKWRPAWIMSKKALHPLWVYGSRMFSSSILSSIVTRLDVFIIAKLFNASTLGYYTRAQSIDSAVKSLSTGSLTSIFFPAAAKLQDDRNRLVQFYRRYLHFVSFLSVGLAGLLYLITPDLFRILFTAKWDMAADYFQIMCIAGAVWPMSALMVSLIAASGNSKTFFRLELIRTVIQLPAYFFGIMAGVTTFLWVFVAVRIISVMLNAFFVSKEIAIQTGEQLLIIFNYIVQGAIAMLVTGFFFDYFSIQSMPLRMAGIFSLYLFIYITAQLITKTTAVKEMIFIWRRFVFK
jgi:O-antigen/teichoic acid export membrane protein